MYFLRPIFPAQACPHVQTGQEEIWVSGRNDSGKNQIKKITRTEPKNRKFNRKNGKSRNSCRVKVGGMGVLCKTGGQDSMYSFTGAVITGFGGDTAFCATPFGFVRGGPSYEEPPSFPNQSE